MRAEAADDQEEGDEDFAGGLGKIADWEGTRFSQTGRARPEAALPRQADQSGPAARAGQRFCADFSAPVGGGGCPDGGGACSSSCGTHRAASTPSFPAGASFRMFADLWRERRGGVWAAAGTGEEEVALGAAAIAEESSPSSAQPWDWFRDVSASPERRRRIRESRVCADCRAFLGPPGGKSDRFSVCEHRKPARRLPLPPLSFRLHQRVLGKELRDSLLARIRRGELPKRGKRRGSLGKLRRRPDCADLCSDLDRDPTASRGKLRPPRAPGKLPKERCGRLCPHNKAKPWCAECNPCEHGKAKPACTMCAGCAHGRRRHHCPICRPCAHGRRRNQCVECRGGCPHGRLPWDCAECQGCPHGRVRRMCGVCNPCPHGLRKDGCKQCAMRPLSGQQDSPPQGRASGLCPHGRVRRFCKDCAGCPHGRLPKKCKECNPCPHGNVASHCAQCKGCPHGRLRKNCAKCVGCPHGRIKAWCKECSACEHGNLPQRCAECRAALPAGKRKRLAPKGKKAEG